MEAVSPTGDDIRAELDRIVGSGVFGGSIRLQRFLRFVVEQSLAGKGDELKEYAIGTGVFDRDDDYDPRIDSIVRVEAGRLRSKLDEYYNGAGASDPVRIGIPRGTYAPVFERRAATASTVAPQNDRRPTITPGRVALAVLGAAVLSVAITAWRSGTDARLVSPARGPTIAVLPFSQFSTDPETKMLAARLTDGVTGELARLGSLGVVSHTSAVRFEGVHKPLKEVAQALNADLVVEGRVEIYGEKVHVQARLVDVKIDRKGWVRDFEGNGGAPAEMERRIAEAIEPVAIAWGSSNAAR